MLLVFRPEEKHLKCRVDNGIWRSVLDGWDLFTLKNIGIFISGDPTTSDRCNWMFSKYHPLKENSTKHTGAHIIAYVENKEHGTTAKTIVYFQSHCRFEHRTPFSAQLSWAPKVPQGLASSPPWSWNLLHGCTAVQLLHDVTAQASWSALVDPR